MKIGWGMADITPRGGKVSLYGQFETRITEEIKDTLHAVAMAVGDDESQCVWVSVDLCEFESIVPREAAARIRETRPDFREEQLVVAATHIHTGPYMTRVGWLSLTGNEAEDEGTLPSAVCRKAATDGIAAAALEALSNMEESDVELAVAPIITGVNRRTVYQDGSARMYGDVHRADFLKMEGRDGGPTQLLYVYRHADHALTGVVANVPCTAQCDEASNYITADYWGVVRANLARELGEQVKVLPLCRAAGDLSPHCMIDWVVGQEANRYGAQASKCMGDWVSEAIVRFQSRTIASYGADAAFRHAWADVDLPVWPVTEAEYEAAKAYMADAANYTESGEAKDKFAYANAWTRVHRVERDPKVCPTRILATRLGDIVLTTYPFELYIEYADRVRAVFAHNMIFDVQLAHECLGYLATPRAVAGGHYSANIFNGVCAPDGGEVLVRRSIDLVREALS